MFRKTVSTRVRVCVLLAGMLLCASHPAPLPAQAPVAANITYDPASYVTTTDIPRIRTESVGKVVSVRGAVTDFKASWNDRAPNIIYLKEGDATLEVVFWNVDGMSMPNFSQPGTPVFATGKVEVYRGRLQLRVDDNLNVSTTPLPLERLAAAVAKRIEAGKTPVPQATSGTPVNKLKWETYSPLKAQEILAEKGTVLVYARSEDVAICQAIEKSYLLHPDAVKMLGSRTIFFLEVSDQKNAIHAKNLRVNRIPSLILLQKEGESRTLAFTQQTTPKEVYDFFKSVPK